MKNKKIYSIGLSAQFVNFISVGKMPIAYLNKMVDGTRAKAFQPYLTQLPEFFMGAEFGFVAGWKLKKFKSHVFNFAEFSTSLSYLTIEGERGIGSIRSTNGFLMGDGTIGNFNFKNVAWTNGIHIHSKSFLHNFAFRAGLEYSQQFSRIGYSNDYSFISIRQNYPVSDQIDVFTNNTSISALSVPLGIKYNASCELNIELVYKPGLFAFSSDFFSPSHYSISQSFGVLMRYKLDTNPASISNKRTDMFF